MSHFAKKIVSLPALKTKIALLRRKGLKIAFTNGCFDLMHLGHVSYLEKAKAKNRILIVGLNSDTSVSKIKDPLRPICPQKSRAAVLAALTSVDFVILFNEETPYKLIKAILPDILVKGADYKNKNVVGSDIVKANGGKLELIKFVQGYSTTNIIKKIAAGIKVTGTFK